jgi:pimeloyl-ACP methyl ester carboxylesterase
MYFDSAGVRIRFIERGAGEPVVLVHSYAGDLESQWVETGVLEALAHTYRAIAFDVRGHGESDKPHDPQAYGAETAWDIVRLLDHLGIEKAHIVGYSMGAHIVAQLLTLAPQRFMTATLGGASGRRGWSAEDDRRTEIESNEMEQGLINAQLMRLWSPEAPPLSAAELKEISDAFLAGKNRYALAALRRSNKAQVVTAEQMAAVRVPVLGIVAAADPYRKSFDALKKIMPQLKIVVLDGATHLTAPVQPSFVGEILAFLRLHRQ